MSRFRVHLATLHEKRCFFVGGWSQEFSGLSHGNADMLGRFGQAGSMLVNAVGLAVAGNTTHRALKQETRCNEIATTL